MLKSLIENLNAMGCSPEIIDGETVKINAPIINAEKPKKRVIWGNIDLNIDDWRDGYAEYCEINELTPGGDNELFYWMVETNAEYLNDEKINLNKKIDGEILIIANLGLWNGRKTGYKILPQNLREILYHGDDYFEIYADGENIRARGIHHDGTNHYLYRATRPGRNVDKLLTAIYNGDEITPAALNYYTRSIYGDVAKIYGW